MNGGGADEAISAICLLWGRFGPVLGRRSDPTLQHDFLFREVICMA